MAYRLHKANVIDLIDIRPVDPASRDVAVVSPSPVRVWRSIRRILQESALCSLATVAPASRAHINTAFFSWSDALELYFLSHPQSLHCRNLSRNRSMAVTVFSSAQSWTRPGRGLQLFGRCSAARGGYARAAERLYKNRFDAYGRWKAKLPAHAAGREYRLYRFVASAIKLLDEPEFGDATFISAQIVRGRETSDGAGARRR